MTTTMPRASLPQRTLSPSRTSCPPDSAVPSSPHARPLGRFLRHLPERLGLRGLSGHTLVNRLYFFERSRLGRTNSLVRFHMRPQMRRVVEPTLYDEDVLARGDVLAPGAEDHVIHLRQTIPLRQNQQASGHTLAGFVPLAAVLLILLSDLGRDLGIQAVIWMPLQCRC